MDNQQTCVCFEPGSDSGSGRLGRFCPHCGRDLRAAAASTPAAMTVWVVTLEWNQPPSEVTGETGIVSVHASEAGARAAQRAEQLELHGHGELVYDYSMREGRFCSTCGEELDPAKGQSEAACKHDVVAFCDRCGAELTANQTCDNDHDDWTIDVHCTEVEVKP